MIVTAQTENQIILIDNIINHLSAKERNLLRQIYNYGFKYKEIATLYNVSEARIAAKRYRLIKKIKKLLEME